MKKFIAITILLTTLAVPAKAYPQEQPHPVFYGPHAVGRKHLTLINEGRATDIDLWYPADVAPGTARTVYDLEYAEITSQWAYDDPQIEHGSFPIITFSHGSNAINFQSYDVMEHWASHGYIVVAPTHVGHDIRAKIAGASDDWPTTLAHRTSDLRFSLDVAIYLFGNHADHTRVASTGHSAGAWVALALATEHGYTFGDVHVEPDRRIDAVLAISPATALMGDEVLADIKKPVMVFGGSADTLLPAVPNSSRLFNKVSSERKFRVDVDNTDHGSPSNVCELRAAILAGGQNPPPILVETLNTTAYRACDAGLRPTFEARIALNYFGTAFFNSTLGGYGSNVYLSRGKARAFPVCYWRGEDVTPTVGRSVRTCLGS